MIYSVIINWKKHEVWSNIKKKLDLKRNYKTDNENKKYILNDGI